VRLTQRAQRIEPFYVMEVAKAAQALALDVAHSGTPMIYLNIGEPDFTAPLLVQEAATRAIRDGQSHYTQATGLPALRERISRWYQQRFGVNVAASRIVVTAGASAALQLACLALIEPGDEVLMPDPSYPCNRHFVTAAGGTAVLVRTNADERFQLSAAKVAAHWRAATRGVLLASPSNPTGTSILLSEMKQINKVVQGQGGVSIVDEIYLGLSYDAAFGQTALSLDDQIISVNSFSKYFNMTGWRLGWLVVPDALVPVIERLAQNLFICPSTISQYAALACFEPDSLAEYERRRAEFKARRDAVIPALNALGLTVPVVPDGAFYAWANCTAACAKLGLPSSWELAFELMRRARVAVTPGRDFGHADTAHFLRFSTANSMAQLHIAMERLTELLA